MKKILLFTICAVLISSVGAQNCSDIFISEYVEASGNDKAIELYNPTNAAIDLGAGQYKMGRQRNGTGEPMLMDITGIIAAHDVRVFALDKRFPGADEGAATSLELQAVADTFLNPTYVETFSPMYFNGDDAFVLGKGVSILLDIFGKLFEDPGEGWYVPGDPNTAWWSVENTLIRKSSVQQGVTTNPTVFDPSLEWDSLPNDTFTELGSHMCACGNTGIESSDAQSTHSFVLFPNPMTNGQMSLKSVSNMAGFRILSMDGKIIMQEQFIGVLSNTNVTLPNAERGVYIAEVEYQDGSRSQQKILVR